MKVTQDRVTEFRKWYKIVKEFSPQLIVTKENDKAPDPLQGSWLKATVSESEATKILQETKKNLGFVASPSSLVVVDLDVKFEHGEGYPKDRKKVLTSLLGKFPPTLTVKTQSGGYHLYYKPGNGITNMHFVTVIDDDTGKNVHMGEIRAKARYVLVPGSEIDGKRYHVVIPTKPAVLNMEDIPQNLLLCSPSARGEPETGGQPPLVSPQAPGEKFFNKWGWDLDDIIFRQPKLAELLTNETPQGYESPSNADEAVASILYFWEFDEPTYERIMWKYRDREDPQRPGKRRFERDTKYLKRTWEKAKQFVGNQTISALLQENGMSPEHWSPKFSVIPAPLVDLERIGISLNITDPIDDNFVTGWVDRLPDGHFLKEYFYKIRKRSDTYPEYILTSGLFALSVALDGKVKIPLSISRLQTNIFALMLGVSSYSRKTTTLFYLNNILDASSLGLSRGSDDMSPEGLVSELADNPNTYYVLDEFGDLLTTMKKTWGAGLMDMFMKLYDGQNHKRKLRSKSYYIKHPYVSMVSSTTPARLYAESNESMVLSGFFPRCLIVAPQRKKEFKPISIDFELDNDMQELGEYLDNIHSWAIKLSELYNQPVYAVFTDDGMNFINKMIVSLEDKLEGLQDMDKEIEAMLWSRYHQYVLKIAVLLKFGEKGYLSSPQFNGVDSESDDGNLTAMLNLKPQVEVKTEYLEMAKELVEKMYYPYAKRVVYDILLAIEKSSFNKVIRLLKKYKVIKRSDLLRRSHVTSREFREIVDTLVERGDIALAKNRADTFVWVGGD